MLRITPAAPNLLLLRRKNEKKPATTRKGFVDMRKSLATGLLIAAVLLVLGNFSRTEAAPVARTPLSAAFGAKTFDDFVLAIHQHESDCRVGAIYGDAGRSYGPLQISYKAWR